jgi:hypothetical protein
VTIIRTTIRTTLVVVAAAVLSSGTAVAAPARPAGPVGTWSGTVTWEGGQTEAILAFRPDGRYCVVDEGAPDPDFNTEGGGTWVAAGGGRFRFSGEERYFDGSGQTLGYLTTQQAAVRRGERFTSSGPAQYLDADRNPTDTFTSSITMRRIGTGTGDC